MPLPAVQERSVWGDDKMANAPELSLRGGRRPTWQSREGSYVFAGSTQLSGQVLRDSHVASLLGMTSRRCVSFEQWPVLIGSACRALSVTFGDSSPRGRAKGASRLAMTNLGALRRRMCAAKIARLHGAQGAPLHFSLARRHPRRDFFHLPHCILLKFTGYFL